MLGELETLHTQGIALIDPAEMSGCLRGRNNLYNHLDFLIKDAKKSVNIMTTEQGFLRKVEGLKASLEKAKKRGVRIRITAPLTKDNRAAADSLKAIAEVKHNEKTNSRFMTVDGHHVVFMTMNDKEVHPSYDIGVWVKTPYFATTMDGFFNTLWNNTK